MMGRLQCRFYLMHAVSLSVAFLFHHVAIRKLSCLFFFKYFFFNVMDYPNKGMVV